MMNEKGIGADIEPLMNRYKVLGAEISISPAEEEPKFALRSSEKNQ